MVALCVHSSPLFFYVFTYVVRISAQPSEIQSLTALSECSAKCSLPHLIFASISLPFSPAVTPEFRSRGSSGLDIISFREEDVDRQSIDFVSCPSFLRRQESSGFCFDFY